MMVKENQTAFRMAITVTSSNKSGVSSRVSVGWCVSVVLVTILMLNASAVAQNDSQEIIAQKINDILQSVRGPNVPQADGKAKSVPVSRLSKTKEGYLNFLGAAPGYDFPVTSVVLGDAQATARNFLAEHGPAFGIRSNKLDFVTKRVRAKDGRNYVRFQQTYAEIPVFAAETIVQLNQADGIEYVLSDIMRDAESLDTGEVTITPNIPPEEAQQSAIEMVEEENPDLQFEADVPKLMIYEPSVVGNVGHTRLVWQTRVRNLPRPFVVEFVLVDAHSGEIALHYSLIKKGKYRIVEDANNGDLNSSIPCRQEGEPPSGYVDCDNAYDYMGDAYDFYYNYHGRDSIDGYGMNLSAIVRICIDGEPCPWPNAAWVSFVDIMLFGEAFVVDDVTGHELTHGVTDYESALVYLNESGAINESFSDMWGEWIDLTNGKGNDSPTVRWLCGEDLPIGAIRDMKDPTVYGDPDRMSSPYWYSGPDDYGGVHTNCGVGNKLCYLLTDGDIFNGYSVAGMGIVKVADVFYEVQTNLLSSGADYADLYAALTQAAINLGWTAAEKQNLKQASQAVEIATNDGQVVEYHSTDVPKTIISGPYTSTLTISDSGTITDVNVKLNITHTWDSDLEVFLIAPDETRVELFTGVGSGGDNFFDTILDDEATTAIISGSAPFTGSYQPEGNLSELCGTSVAGIWMLEITDTYPPSDDGVLNSWSLIIETPYGGGCEAVEGFETGDFGSFSWVHSGEADWIVTSAEKNTGIYSAKAGTISHSQSSSLEVTLECASGNVGFYRKISSEAAFDKLKFYIDEVEVSDWSGFQDWSRVSYPVSAGTRTFKWSYLKDGSVSIGSDTAWIDDIVFPKECVYVGDFDEDGDVDIADLDVLCESWLTDDPVTDIVPAEGDGMVNFPDFAEFAIHWLEGVG
ncbi:MAG: M4 family metallopeptidase [Planctomycetota bacterium]